MRALALFVVLAVCPAIASGQDIDATISETQAVADRVERETACLSHKHAELHRIVRQMEEARTQVRDPTSSAAAREDGRLALRALTQRAVRVERSVAQCHTEPSARARRPGPAEGVTTRRAPESANDRAVGEPNDATRVIERDVILQPNVGVVIGEQVDGTGHVAPEEVRAAIRGTASRFSRCYDQLVDRGALTRGTIIVTFRVTGSGRTTSARAHHGTMNDSRFVRCVASAARRIRTSSPPTGGDAVYSYTLRFPGPSR